MAARPPDELDAHLDADRLELVKKWHITDGEEVDEADVRKGVGALEALGFESASYELDDDELIITISDAEMSRRDAVRLISGDFLDAFADESPEVVREVVAALDIDPPAGGPAVGFQ